MKPTPDQVAIDSLVAKLAKDRAPKTSTNGHARPPVIGIPNVNTIIENLRKDPQRREIFDGGIGTYESASEADARMFHNLAYFCRKDLELMEEVARKSSRIRPKWDERRNGTTWLRWELEKAAKRTEDVWEPSARASLTIVQRSQKHQQEGDEEKQILSPFVRADLAQALREGVDPPEELVCGILLKGKVHSIYGPGGTGKTFMMLYIILRVIRQGLPVVVFDMENGLRIIAERLETLGVTPEQAALVHYFPFPAMPLESSVIEAYEELLEEIDPALVVFDSWINCLAACGLDENSSVDIAAWADAYSQRARHQESAVLILDHVPKEGNTARGSGRKLDYVDVQWELRNPQPFNRKTVGRIDLFLKKDREGWLPNIQTFSVGGGDEGFIFTTSMGLLLQVDEEGLLPSDATVKDALRSLGDSGAKDKSWKEAATARGVPRSTYYHSRKSLLDKGHVEHVMDRYFIKDLQNDESNVVQDSLVGPLDQGQTGKSNWSNDPRSWTNGPPPETCSVDEQNEDWGEV